MRRFTDSFAPFSRLSDTQNVNYIRFFSIARSTAVTMRAEMSVDPADVNDIAVFLACNQIPDLNSAEPVDCIVLCGSAILHCAETVFRALESRPDLAKTLVICGGIGHSSPLLYEAIAKNAKYKALYPEINGFPEARILDMILSEFYASSTIRQSCKVLVEDQSTNCGSNAIETRRTLEASGIETPQSFIIVQDPTMSLRTLAGFEKAYAGAERTPTFTACSTFVPKVSTSEHGLIYCTAGVDASGLWDIERILDLLLGEIPRLRDDENGYGPRGKGFIPHVEVPASVMAAWERLRRHVSSSRS